MSDRRLICICLHIQFILMSSFAKFAFLPLSLSSLVVVSLRHSLVIVLESLSPDAHHLPPDSARIIIKQRACLQMHRMLVCS